jgi:hypothetical protein
VRGALIFRSSPLQGLQKAVLYNKNSFACIATWQFVEKMFSVLKWLYFLFVTECGTVNIVFLFIFLLCYAKCFHAISNRFTGLKGALRTRGFYVVEG